MLRRKALCRDPSIGPTANIPSSLRAPGALQRGCVEAQAPAVRTLSGWNYTESRSSPDMSGSRCRLIPGREATADQSRIQTSPRTEDCCSLCGVRETLRPEAELLTPSSHSPHLHQAHHTHQSHHTHQRLTRVITLTRVTLLSLHTHQRLIRDSPESSNSPHYQHHTHHTFITFTGVTTTSTHSSESSHSPETHQRLTRDSPETHQRLTRVIRLSSLSPDSPDSPASDSSDSSDSSDPKFHWTHSEGAGQRRPCPDWLTWQ